MHVLAFIIILSIAPFAAIAEEPGQFHLENPPPEQQPEVKPQPEEHPDSNPPAETRTESPNDHTLLKWEFTNARGLTAFDIRGMQYNRVSCDRRLFAPTGASVEGDGDIKVTHIEPDFVEIEMPSHISFVAYGMVNPYQNGVAEVESLMGRRLLDLQHWSEGQSLRIEKYVTVSFSEENTQPATVQAVDEVRALAGTYPNMYVVKETVFLEKKFSLYFLCQ